MDTTKSCSKDAAALMRAKLEEHYKVLETWRQPKEPLLFEAVRALDYVFCEELFHPQSQKNIDAVHEKSLISWGVNKVLARLIPDDLLDGPFKFFRSRTQYQEQTDAFLLHAGIAERAELFLGWLEEGLLEARIDEPRQNLTSWISKILVLKSTQGRLFREALAVKHHTWRSEQQMVLDAPIEEALGERYTALLPALENLVGVHDGWGITYRTTEEVDAFFLEYGQLYLRRMWGQDVIGLEERIGGNQFNEYLAVLAALGGRGQKHLCFANILKKRHPHLDLRNLLTTFVPYEEFITVLAIYLDADTEHVRRLLTSLTLDPSNRDHHTSSGFPAWAPVIRASRDFCILPLYGLEINPFFFLLDDLQFRYPDDWFRLANNRERRWIEELAGVFPGPRWRVAPKNVLLRSGSRVYTDIDFVAFDTLTNELALFQLKWQKPIGADNRARRSAGKNLCQEGTKWVTRVFEWLERHDLQELASRCGLGCAFPKEAVLFGLARYNAFYSGHFEEDKRCTWASWQHFIKVRVENYDASPSALAAQLRVDADAMTGEKKIESCLLPLSDLAVLLNPASEPSR